MTFASPSGTVRYIHGWEWQGHQGEVPEGDQNPFEAMLGSGGLESSGEAALWSTLAQEDLGQRAGRSREGKTPELLDEAEAQALVMDGMGGGTHAAAWHPGPRDGVGMWSPPKLSPPQMPRHCHLLPYSPA